MESLTEHQVWARVWMGDEAARREIARRYIPLVKRLARKTFARIARCPLVDAGDLVSWGMVGLMKAVDAYDPNRGVKFATYAGRRAQGAMLDALRELDWVPRGLRAQVRAGTATATQMVPLGDEAEPLAATPALIADDPEEFWKTLTRGLTQLESRVLLGYYREGLSASRIARRCRAQVSQVEALLPVLEDRIRHVLAGRPR